MAIRVLLVDDHDLVRVAVARLLTLAAGIEVVGECPDGRDAVRSVMTAHPDVVVMDVHLPGRSGIEVTREIVATDPLVRVLMVTGAREHHWMLDSIAVGAAGYLLKSGDALALVSAVRVVAAGGSVWPDDGFRPAAATV